MSVISIAPVSVGFFVEGADELRDEIWHHQLVAQSVDDPCFDFASTDACTIGTIALASGCGTGDIVLADRRGGSTANAANYFFREDMLGPPVGPEFRGASLDHPFAVPDGAEPGLYTPPEIIVDDPKLRDIADDPLLAGIEPGNSSPSRRLLAVAQPIPDESPHIELIAKYARSPEGVPSDRRITPGMAARPLNVLAIEFGGDPTRTLARSKIRVNATNDRRLRFVDFAPAALAVLGSDDLVAVTEPAARSALFDAPPKAATCLSGQILEEECVHRAF